MLDTLHCPLRTSAKGPRSQGPFCSHIAGKVMEAVVSNRELGQHGHTPKSGVTNKGDAAVGPVMPGRCHRFRVSNTSLILEGAVSPLCPFKAGGSKVRLSLQPCEAGQVRPG